MILAGEHLISYTYSQPVELGVHYFRMLPRTDPCQRIVSFNLDIRPRPLGKESILDGENNEILTAWFSSPTSAVNVHVTFQVETSLENPFSFSLNSTGLPPELSAADRQLFHSNLRTETSAAIDALKQQLLNSCHDALSYVTAATQWIADNINVVTRPDGAPQGPHDTLIRRSGACRDSAVLLMTLCRNMSIPARYVSGYCFHGAPHTDHELHSWVETWIPNGGWRGFDPTLGLATTVNHIALCASAYPGLTLPVEGCYGGDATTTMQYEVNLHQVDAPARQIPKDSCPGASGLG